MPRDIATTLYTYSELSETAQEKARDGYRAGGLDYEWWDGVYSDFEAIAAILGIEVSNKYFSGFCSQGDGASFFGSYSYRKGALRELIQYAPKDEKLHAIARTMQDAQKRVFYKLTAEISQGRGGGSHVHECTMSVDVQHYDGVEWSQNTYNELQDAIQGAMRHLAQWHYSQLEREFDYLSSDDAITESIEANEYEYTESGCMQ